MTGLDVGATGSSASGRQMEFLRNAAEAVARGEDIARAVLDALPIPVYLTDAGGALTYYNEAATRLWGRRPDPGAARWCGAWRLYTTDGAPLAHEDSPMAVALRERRPIEGVEMVAERADGARLRVQAFPTPLIDADGVVRGGMNVLVDVTDQRRTREQIEESEARYRSIFESARVSLWEEDLSGVLDVLEESRTEGVTDIRAHLAERPDRVMEAIRRVRVRDVNAFTLELFEASSKESIIRSLEDIFLPESTPVFVEELVALWERRTFLESEVALRTLGGRRLDMLLTITFAGERCERTLVSIQDISQRRRAEARVRDLASIIESSDDGIYSHDVDGVIVSWNEGAARLYGYAAEEAVGQPIDMLIPEAAQDDMAALLARIWRGERVDHYETVRLRKDGSLVDISLTVSPVKGPDGKVIGASKIARDISERRRAEQQQELLLGEIRHRMRNTFSTMQAIVGQTLKSASKEERDAFVARLRALAGSHDLLTVGAWRRARLVDVVDQALEAFREERADRFRVDGDRDVWLDGARTTPLIMVLHELATNAVKHGALSRPEGRVCISWALDERDGEPSVTLVWRERGGPPVSPPARRSFGSAMIERALSGDGGGAHMDFRPEGLVCTLTFTP